MARRFRRLSETEIRALWARWQRGESLRTIAEVLRVHTSTIWWAVQRRGGLVPPRRQRAARVLQTHEREELSRGVAQGESLRSVARRLGRAPSTISREIRRHGGTIAYRASTAEAAAWQRARRPKRCRLAQHRRLCRAGS